MNVHTVRGLTDNLANTCHFEREDKWVQELRDLSAIEEQGWFFASQFSVISSLPQL